MTTEKEVEPSASILETVPLEADILDQEDTGIHTVEPAISVSGGCESCCSGSVPRESVALETEAAVPTISTEMTTPIAVANEAKVPIAFLPVEPTRPSSFLAITEGNYHQDCSFYFFMNDLLDLVIY